MGSTVQNISNLLIKDKLNNNGKRGSNQPDSIFVDNQTNKKGFK